MMGYGRVECSHELVMPVPHPFNFTFSHGYDAICRYCGARVFVDDIYGVIEYVM